MAKKLASMWLIMFAMAMVAVTVLFWPESITVLIAVGIVVIAGATGLAVAVIVN